MSTCPNETASGDLAYLRPRFRFTLRDMLVITAVIGLLLTPISYFGVSGVLISGGMLVIAYMVRDVWQNASVFAVAVLVLLALYVGAAAWPAVSAYVMPTAGNQSSIWRLRASLQNYALSNGHYPVPVVKGPDGRAWHSWRVALLPFVGEEMRFNVYLPTEPWDGPTNRMLAPFTPFAYRAQTDYGPKRATDFVLVCGPDSAWSGTQPPTPADFQRLPPDTVIMLEVKDSGIHWMEPRDWTIDEIMKRVDDAGLGALGPYSEGINVLRADLACETLDPAMDRESLRRRLTAADD